ncbi:MAG: cupin domain-containing protein [Saprospiraceae bacterium]|nr:cupin domain-containing protein [Saprospiraceae bacterium]
MKPEIVLGSSLEEFYTEERCRIGEIYNRSEDKTHSLARTTVAAGVTTAWHKLRATSEIYFILEGLGEIEIGEGIKQILRPGDSAMIPADVPQRITNMGDADLVFLCICCPAFLPDCYIHLE